MGTGCWIAENATLAGDLIMGDHCSVWFQAVIRADVHSIRLGNYVNVQDGAILHCTYEKADTVIGNRVSIGHRAIVHGAHIDDDVLIGMGAIVMDHAKVPSHVVIGAGAIVLEGKQLESGGVYVGSPARKVKELDTEQFDYLIKRTAKNYKMYSEWYRK